MKKLSVSRYQDRKFGFLETARLRQLRFSLSIRACLSPKDFLAEPNS